MSFVGLYQFNDYILAHVDHLIQFEFSIPL